MPRRAPLPTSRGAAAAGQRKRPGAPRPAAAPLLRPFLLAACLGSLLPAAAGSSALGNGECGEPKDVAHAAIPKGSSSMRLRYTCDKPYKRQAGTSSLTVCEQDQQTKTFRWSEPQIKCIKTEPPTAAPPEISDAHPPTTPAQPFGGQTVSLAAEASSSAGHPLGITEPSSESSVPPTTATREQGQLAPSTVSDNVDPLQSRTPVCRSETSTALEVPTWGPQTASAPFGEAVGGSTKQTSGSSWRRIADSLLFRIGFPFIAAAAAAGIILGSVYWCYRRRRNLQRQPAFPPIELTSIDAAPLDGGGLETSTPDPGSVNEEDPMLPPPGITSTG